jgi:hypothetical protein
MLEAEGVHNFVYARTSFAVPIRLQSNICLSVLDYIAHGIAPLFKRLFEADFQVVTRPLFEMQARG